MTDSFKNHPSNQQVPRTIKLTHPAPMNTELQTETQSRGCVQRSVRRFKWLPTIAEALRFRAEQMRYTDRRMAKELGMQPSHYSEVLKGKRALPMRATKRAFAMGVPAKVLLQESEPRQ